MSRIFNFKQQKRLGDLGEALFLQKWPGGAKKHPELKGPDFILPDGRLAELKCDSYPMKQTANFFIERWSDHAKKSPGGPWQADGKSVQVFVYLFLTDRRWFVFEDVPALLKRLDELVESEGLRMHYIENANYFTGGYKVPRLALKDLYREEVL